MDPCDSFNTLCDAAALIYHEGRNVRHLIRANLLEHDLVNALRSADSAAAQEILMQLKSARHNTGSLYEKLIRLEKTEAEREKFT